MSLLYFVFNVAVKLRCCPLFSRAEKAGGKKRPRVITSRVTNEVTKNLSYRHGRAPPGPPWVPFTFCVHPILVVVFITALG